MIKYQDYEEELQKLNITEHEGKILLEYLNEIIEITIDIYNDRRK